MITRRSLFGRLSAVVLAPAVQLPSPTSPETTIHSINTAVAFLSQYFPKLPSPYIRTRTDQDYSKVKTDQQLRDEFDYFMDQLKTVKGIDASQIETLSDKIWRLGEAINHPPKLSTVLDQAKREREFLAGTAFNLRKRVTAFIRLVGGNDLLRVYKARKQRAIADQSLEVARTKLIAAIKAIRRAERSEELAVKAEQLAGDKEFPPEFEILLTFAEAGHNTWSIEHKLQKWLDQNDSDTAA